MLSTATARSAHAANGRLIVASNRAPVEHVTNAAGRVEGRVADGGLITALGSIACGQHMTWIAAAGTAEDRSVASRGPLHLDANRRLRFVTPPALAYELSYGGFCNPVLWFLQHSLWHRLPPERDAAAIMRAWLDGYVPVNRAFAATIAEELRGSNPADRVMLHDYHLYLAPRFLRELGSRATLQHFVHIPWPAPAAWRRLPRAVVAAICEGLLANDSVVFQTPSSARDFLRTCDDVLAGVELRSLDGTVAYRGRRTRVSANPISVDARALLAQVESPAAQGYIDALRAPGGEQTIVRVDRLDPSKNVAAGFHAFDLLLRTRPEWRGRVRLLAFLVPSRTNVPEYRAYADEVLALAEAINARHTRGAWKPISILYEQNRLQALAAMTLYDVLLVNSVADGMNLVAKEGPVVNRRDGAVVLSTKAGAFAELQHGALAIEPEDIEATAGALHRALMLPASERRRRAGLLRRAVLKWTLDDWLRVQLQDLASVAGREARALEIPRRAAAANSVPA